MVHNLNVIRREFAFSSFLSQYGSLDLFLHIIVDTRLLTYEKLSLLMGDTDEVSLAMCLYIDPGFKLGLVEIDLLVALE